ncbi:vigilin-like [Ptychodera flava]|uniref:vigilin-like n=1 Tax=Ptychodera flava TaxID=63121 RepID=UPI00396A4E4E
MDSDIVNSTGSADHVEMDATETVDDQAYQPTYAEAFPPLPTAVTSQSGSVSPTSTMTAAEIVASRGSRSQGYPTKMAVKSSTVTQVFHVPLEERRYRDFTNEQRFGEAEQSNKICYEIMQKTGTHIEMSMSKDQSLTIMVTGKADAVMQSRRELISKLQTQANVSLPIPKEHHRFLLGKGGSKLKELELNTSTKINVPRTEDNSDQIKIMGTKEGIEKAKHEIQLISEEQSKLAFERLKVEKAFHPFISGPTGKNGPPGKYVQDLMDQTGAKIHVPPPSVHKDEIVVSGEKEGVMKAIQSILATYEEKKRKTTTVSLEVRKSQHKYVIGPRGNNIQEILATTGVSVELPPSDSPSETITLRGEQDKLGPAITQVYAKANSIVISEVKAPAWLHKFIIGRQGQNIKSITQELPRVHIEFEDGKDTISVEGPPEEVDQARKALHDIAKDLQERFVFAEIQVDPKYHRHIIGKSGANVTRIKGETGVSIHIPGEEEISRTIRIEGSPKGVEQAKNELLELVHKMENEKSRDILIEQRFHRTIIGAKGENIRDIRDKFNQVNITFPDPGKKSDVVTLRGPKQDVDKCYRFLQQLNTELVANNYKIEIPIFKKFHKNIIGKGGATISKIKEETDTRIEIPSEDSDSDMIVIIGKKDRVESARDKIQAIQKELANVTQVEVSIAAKYHQSLIGAKGRLVRSIMDDCGGVMIHFPNESSGSDKVTIRGPKDDVDKAKKSLMELANERALSSFSAEIHAKPEYHKFLIGRGGANIRKVRDKTGARIVFPTAHDEDQELITIIGKKECVDDAKGELEKLIKNLDNIAESEITVDPKYHRHFVARRGQVLREIGDDFGGVTVSFPRSGTKSDKVTLKGAKDCVEGAKKRITEIVNELESQVTIECIIPQIHHRTVMGAKGAKVQAVTADCEVGIKFPDRNPNIEQTNGNAESDPVVNGDGNSENSEEDRPKKSDIILITGKKENCEKAKAALMALVPVTEEIDVPYDLHRFIIGQKGVGVRKMMDEHDVNIAIPAPEKKSNAIKVTGPPANVSKAKIALQHRVEELEKEKEDRVLRSFQMTVQVQPIHHPKIIGRRGQVITKIRQEHDVNIQFPEKNSENDDIITITGYEHNANGAKDAILKIVQELEDMTTLPVHIDRRVHPRLIGNRGRAIHKVMDDYKVDIRFPRSSDPDPDLVTITGPEDNAYDAKDHLQNLEEEYMQDIKENELLKQYMRPQTRNDAPLHGGNRLGFVVRDAPWDQPPDTASTQEYPSLVPTPSQAGAPSGPVAWGPSKRFP